MAPLLIIGLILAWQVLVPLGFLVLSSLKTVAPGRAGYWSIDFTLENYARAFGSGYLASAALNTLAFAVPSAALAFVAGTYLAWLTQRTNVPCKLAFYVLALGQIVLPGILSTIAWMFLLAPRIGLLNLLFADAFGLPHDTFNVFSLPGMVWVQTQDMLPLAFLLMSAVLRSMDPTLEESASASGAGRLATFARVTLPLMRPGSLAVLMLLMVNGIEAFEVPALLGIRANYLVFSTEVYLATRSMPRLDIGLAGAYAMVLVLLSVAAIAVYYRLLGTGEQFATVGAKGFRPRLVDLGAWRGLAVASALALLGIMFVLPLLTIAWAALLPYLQYPSPTSLAQVSLRNFQSLFAQAIVPRAFINSFLIGVGTAFLVCLVTSVTAYLTVKTRLPGRQLLDWLAFVPLAIPGTVVALSVLWTYLSLRVPVYGTLWIILAAYLTKYLPVAMRINSASMAQIHRDMEEAASTSGAGWATRLRVVLLPLMKPGLVAAWIWVMVHACREVSVGVMLYVPGTETIGVALFDLTADGGNYPRVAAFGVVIFGLLVVLSLLARAVGARRVTT